MNETRVVVVLSFYRNKWFKKADTFYINFWKIFFRIHYYGMKGYFNKNKYLHKIFVVYQILNEYKVSS